MSLASRTALRLLGWMGLDLDFAISLQDEPTSRIRDGLFLGVRPGPDDVDALEDEGVSRVISCLPESERAAMAFLGDRFETLFLPLYDRMDEDIAACLPAVSAFAGDGTLIHCEVGVSRSASLTIAVLMQTEGTRFFETYESVRRRRSKVLPNIGFASQLQQLEHSLFGPAPDGELSSLARYLREVCNVPVEVDVIQNVLAETEYDAVGAIRTIFGEIPRVVQGVR